MISAQTPACPVPDQRDIGHRQRQAFTGNRLTSASTMLFVDFNHTGAATGKRRPTASMTMPARRGSAGPLVARARLLQRCTARDISQPASADIAIGPKVATVGLPAGFQVRSRLRWCVIRIGSHRTSPRHLPQIATGVSGVLAGRKVLSVCRSFEGAHGCAGHFTGECSAWRTTLSTASGLAGQMIMQQFAHGVDGPD